MSKLPAKPRLIGATVLSLLALIAIAAILPATGHAAPPSSGFPLAATSSVFAKTTVGSGSEKLPVELTNVSGEAVLVTGFSLEGPDAGDFVVNEFPCGMLAPGASCTAGLYFYPHRVGEEHATLRLDLYNQPTEYVELSGTGVPPELSFSPPSYDFGLQRVNRESVSTSLQVENSGEAAVQINNFEIAGPGSSAFWTGSSSCWGTWLAPGQACSMEVSFGPRERTAYEAQLRAWVNGEAFGADLRGQGGRAVVEASENPLEFGTATAGSAGAVRTLTLTNTGDLPESFFIGVVASLSTCMAVVGGLVLSMSATFAREGDKVRPQILFHVGRIVSFFILGGVIGALGAAFTLGTAGTFILGLLIGIVMLILGINLLDVFPSFKRFQPAMPRFLARHALGVSELNHWLTPLLVGVATFFLPCGFTQAMQLYSLTTGSFLAGGFTMLAFALGTLPVLALIGFSSFSIRNSAKAGIFFKSAGLIVILFALFNIINSLVVIGLISPMFNF